MFELTEDFIKMLQIAFLVTGTLSIFLIFISYEVTVLHNEKKREALLLLEDLLTDRCLTVVKENKPVKALFSSEKIGNLDPNCIHHDDVIIEIELIDGTKQWIIEIGSSTNEVQTEKFNIAIDMKAEGINPATIRVSL